MVIHQKEVTLETVLGSATFKVVVWLVSTMLSIGVVYGSVQTRIAQLETDQKRLMEILDRIDQKTGDLPLLKQLILKHMEKDTK